MKNRIVALSQQSTSFLPTLRFLVPYCSASFFHSSLGQKSSPSHARRDPRRDDARLLPAPAHDSNHRLIVKFVRDENDGCLGMHGLFPSPRQSSKTPSFPRLKWRKGREGRGWEKKKNFTLSLSPIAFTVSVRHSVVDATTKISSAGTSRHHSASAVRGSLYGSGAAFPRKAWDHLLPSVSFIISLFLYLSKDGVGEKAAQGVRSTMARKGVESGRRGGILGCGCKMCERMPRVRCPPGTKFSGAYQS